MKLTKTASGKQAIKMSKTEWLGIGKRAGWLKKMAFGDLLEDAEKFAAEIEARMKELTWMEKSQRTKPVLDSLLVLLRSQDIEKIAASYGFLTRMCVQLSTKRTLSLDTMLESGKIGDRSWERELDNLSNAAYKLIHGDEEGESLDYFWR